MSDTTSTDGTIDPQGTKTWAAFFAAEPVRDEQGRFVYDPSYRAEDGDRFDADGHLAGLDGNDA